jgi:GntR family transcriptional regulator
MTISLLQLNPPLSTQPPPVLACAEKGPAMGNDAANSRSADWLRRSILQFINDNQFRPGEKLGTERQLADQFGVTRGQLRKSLEELESGHFLRRATGSAGGIFVDDGRLQRQLNTIQGVPSLLRQQGKLLRTQIVRSGITVASPYERRNLGLQPDMPVITIERLRLVDDLPWSLETSTLPAHRFTKMLTQDLTGSVYSLLESLYHVEPSIARETLDVTSAEARQADLLGVSVGHPMIEIWRTCFDQDGQPFEIGHDFFLGDRTRVHTERYGANWKRALSGEAGRRDGH